MGQTKEQKKTKLLKELLDDQYTKRAIANVDRLFNSQLALAVGCIEIFKEGDPQFSNKSMKKTIRVLDPDEIIACLDDDEEKIKELNGGNLVKYNVVALQKPDNKAIIAILNRAFGKPRESLDVTTDGEKIDGFSYVAPKKPKDKKED